MDSVRTGNFPMTYKAYRYTESTKDRLRISIQREWKQDEEHSYIFWKLQDLTFTAVERSTFFKEFIAMFLSLGRQILHSNNLNSTQIPSAFEAEIAKNKDHSKTLKDFGTLVKKLDMPLLPGNAMD